MTRPAPKSRSGVKPVAKTKRKPVRSKASDATGPSRRPRRRWKKLIGRVEQIDKERAALDGRAEAEEPRWKKNKERLDDALRRSRTASYSRPV